MTAQELDIEKHAPNMSEELKRALIRTHAALQKRWEEDKKDAETVYEIDIPAQSLTISGETRAQNVLLTLKSLKVTDTYRIRKGGADAGNRA